MTASAFASSATSARTRRIATIASLLLLGAASWLASGTAAAQSLPVSVETAGNSATIAVDIGSEGEAMSTVSTLLEPMDGRFAPTSTEVKLDFDDVRSLSAANLGVSAERVGPASPALLARMPDPQLVRLPHALPMLVTIQPSDRSGFAFNRTVEVEIHTHDLTYTPGSSYRLFKASPGEGFRDITSDIGPGSVRARGTTGGFSQFLIVEDLRDTRTVIAEKVDRMRGQVQRLPAAAQARFGQHLDTVVASVDSGDYANAIAALDTIRAEAAVAAANRDLPATWQAVNQRQNHAGELIAGAATLKFSVAFLRDFGR